MRQHQRLRGSRNRFAISLSVAALTTFSGCSTPVVVSEFASAEISPDNPDDKGAELVYTPKEGLTYFLPRRQIKLTLERKAIDFTTLAVAQTEAASARKVANDIKERAIEAFAELKAAQDALDAAGKSGVGADTPGNKILENRRNEARKAYAAAAGKLGPADVRAEALEGLAKSIERELKNLAGKLDQSDVKEVTEGFSETATIEQLPLEPDPKWMFVANLNHRNNRADDVKIKVVNGLLTSTDVDTTDKTAQIVVDLARSISAVAGAPGGATIKMLSGGPVGPMCVPYKVEVIFDPLDKQSVSNASRTIAAAGGKVEIAVSDWASTRLISPKDDKNEPEKYLSTIKESALSDTPLRGLAYRRSLPYVVEVTPRDIQCQGVVMHRTTAVRVDLPNNSPIHVLPMTGGAFTQTTIKTTFKDGMPEDYNVNRPSEVAAVASLPVDIAKAIISVPTEMLQLKVNYNTQDIALTQAQKNALDAEVALIEARRRYEEAMEAQRVAAE